MSGDLKTDLKKMAGETGIRITGSFLRWRYKKEGKHIPPEKDLEEKSRKVLEQTQTIIARRGKNILNELKGIWGKKI
jgi:hypothetical protein